MQWRRTELGDFERIREIWTEAQYQFEFPDLESKNLLSSWVALEDGKIVAWAGAQLVPEVIAMMAPDWGNPHERRKLFATLHRPVAQDARDKGYERGFANMDPGSPSFGRHLAKMGWIKGWATYWALAERILGKKP